MKSTLKTRVAGFFACLTLATNIGSAGAQESEQNHAITLPPIVSADKATPTGGVLGPIIKPVQQNAPVGSGMLTPMIESNIQESEVDIAQVAATQHDEAGYSIRQAALPTAPPIVQGSGSRSNAPLPAVPSALQGSGSGSRTFAPSISSAPSPLPLDTQPQNSMVIGQGNFFPTESVPSSTTVLGSDCNTCVTGSSIGQPVFQPPASATPVIGCSSCGTSDCSCGGSGGAVGPGGTVSSCQGCGTGGCCDQAALDKRFAACGFISRARQYALFDVLYFNRAGGEPRAFNLSPANDFQAGLGARVTIGRRQDAASGREFTYYGTYDIDDAGTVTDTLGRIQPRFLTADPFLSAASISGLTNVTTLTEEIETQFQSFEYNRVRWGWDVVKLMIGVRYIFLEDEYLAQTQNLLGETGSFGTEATNNLIGPQIGGELFYDVGYRWSLSGFGKIGYLLNAHNSDLQVNNNGFPVVDSGGSSTTGSFLLDLGITAHYQLNSRSRFRVGYNLLYLDQVATADEAVPLALSSIDTVDSGDDDVFFHGLSLGLEFYR